MSRNYLLVINDGYDNSGGHVKIISKEVKGVEAAKSHDFTKLEVMGGTPIALWDVGDVSLTTSFYDLNKTKKIIIFLIFSSTY